MIQLNLLPDIKKESIKAQQTKSLVISIAIIATIAEIGISVLLFVYVTFVQSLQVNLLNDDISSKSAELKKIPDVEKYLTVQNQLAALDTLHDQKGAYSRLLNFLPVLNPNEPNNVAISNLQLNTADDSISLSGTTSTFQAMNVFVDTLRNAQASLLESGQTAPKTVKMFENVAVQSGGLGRLEGKEIVTFLVQVQYNKAVFDTRNTTVLPIVPNKKTTQSVTNSPTQLFDQQNTEAE